MTDSSDARRAILRALRALGVGEVVSYGELARRAGLPRRARLAARVLATSGDPALPWHRVLRADGRIAFAPGSDAHAEQERRLRAEGVELRNGRVAVALPPRTAGSLDALLWAPADEGGD